MLSTLTNAILEGIRSHGMLAVIMGVAIETIIVPIPSPLILMAAGFILIRSNSFITAVLAATWISIIAGLAQTIGSYFVYSVAYFGGKPLIEKYEKLHGVSWKEITQFQKKFGKGRREDLMLFVLRALPIMPLSVISGVAGVLKMDFKRYSLATFFGVIPRNIFLALLGWKMQEVYYELAHKIDSIETIATIFIISFGCVYVLLHKFNIISNIRRKILE